MRVVFKVTEIHYGKTKTYIRGASDNYYRIANSEKVRIGDICEASQKVSLKNNIARVIKRVR